MSVSKEKLEQMISEAEMGWSEEVLDACESVPGVGMLEVLPAYLYNSFEQKARSENKTSLEVIEELMTDYLTKQPA